MLEALRTDLRSSLRGLRREPVLVLATFLTLAICLGANTTVFSLANSILLRPLPFPAADRLYWLSERMGREQMEVALAPDYFSIREQRRSFDDVAAYETGTVNWDGLETPEQLSTAHVSASFFTVLGMRPTLGRYLSPQEEGRSAPAVAVVSHAFWRTRLASDQHAVGRTIRLDGAPVTVIGVMPQGFDYPKGVQLWRPLTLDATGQLPRSQMRPMRLVHIIARVQEHVGEGQLAAEMARLTNTIRAEYPKEFDTSGFLDGMRILAEPLQRRMTGDVRPALLALSGAIALVLLIACANLANLLLARAASRQKELAVRMALGSGRARIVRQVLAESIALALPGGLAGIALAYVAVAGLNAWKPMVLASYPPITLDLRTLSFGFGLTLITGLVFGLPPACGAAATRIQDAFHSESYTSSGGQSATRLRQLLVVLELAVSLVLLIGAGLLARSFLNLARTDLGFSPENLLTMRVNLVAQRYANAATQVGFYNDVLARMQSLPMVRAAAVSTDVPLSGERPYQEIVFQVAGRGPLPVAQRPRAASTVVSPGFFGAMGIPLLQGRTFDATDTLTSWDSIVVNQEFARKILPGENPIGRQIVFGQDDSTRWTIAGVIGNIRGSDLGAPPSPLIYRCTTQAQRPFLSRMTILVRTVGDARAAARTLEQQVYSVDRGQPLFDIRTMEERLAGGLAPSRFNLMLIGTFALIAMVLAALGVYGVLSYLVHRRTREIGIRLALGARPEQVRQLVVTETFTLAAAASIAGLCAAWALTRYLGSILYGVSALDAATLVAMPVLLIAVALAAAYLPASRASRIDPITALRQQ